MTTALDPNMSSADAIALTRAAQLRRYPDRRPRLTLLTPRGLMRCHADTSVCKRDKAGREIRHEYEQQHAAGDPLRRVLPISRKQAQHLMKALEWAKKEKQ